MDYSKIVFIFALGNNTDAIMLGIESPRKPITGQFAKELREALVRARTGNLNQSEKNSILRFRRMLFAFCILLFAEVLNQTVC